MDDVKTYKTRFLIWCVVIAAAVLCRFGILFPRPDAVTGLSIFLVMAVVGALYSLWSWLRAKKRAEEEKEKESENEA